MCLSPRRRPVAPAHNGPRHTCPTACLPSAVLPPSRLRPWQGAPVPRMEGALGVPGTVSSLLFAPSALAARFHEAL